MQDSHIEAFQQWWSRSRIGDDLRSWADLKEAVANIPRTPKRLARAAWNAAFYVLSKEKAKEIAAVRDACARRVAQQQRYIDAAKAEIDVLERRAPMPEDEFHARMLTAKNSVLLARVRDLTGQEPDYDTGPAQTSALRAAIAAGERAAHDAAATMEALNLVRRERDSAKDELHSAMGRILDLERALMHAEKRYEALQTTIRNDKANPLAVRAELARALRSLADAVEKP